MGTNEHVPYTVCKNDLHHIGLRYMHEQVQLGLIGHAHASPSLGTPKGRKREGTPETAGDRTRTDAEILKEDGIQLEESRADSPSSSSLADGLRSSWSDGPK